jgi:hypothetical protein
MITNVSDDDPTLQVVASEFSIYGGRQQHRPTYDTGRKAHDGTGADLDTESRLRRRDHSDAVRNRLVVRRTDDGLQVTFEDPA